MRQISQQNLTSHELIGLRVNVFLNSFSDNVEIAGKVVNESRNMIIISDNCEKKAVPKKNNIFYFTLPSGQQVRIMGDKIVGRPVERTRKRRRR